MGQACRAGGGEADDVNGLLPQFAQRRTPFSLAVTVRALMLVSQPGLFRSITLRT